MHIITTILGQLGHYKPKDNINVIDNEVNSAREIVGIFVNRFKNKKMDDIEIVNNTGQLIINTQRSGFAPMNDPSKKLSDFYESINKFELKGGIFNPVFVKI
ncbi:unnamed protein product [Meloidogyne enterolobii]|uniref:Uncharacterized protein n=1 Tax=Meloidogyne enterolobii TaxID=390850 RepID=A0ACB1AQY6_MELEN